MNIKNLYIISVIGIFFAGLGTGWIIILHVINSPLNHLHAIGLGMIAIGLVIMIKTLSTIRKIDLVIED